MKVAFVAPECDPFVKVGGLADVVSSLPRTLQQHGMEVSVFVPRFGSIDPAQWKSAREVATVILEDEGLPRTARILRVVSRDIPIHFVDCPELYESNPLPYGNYANDPERWAFFNLAVLEYLQSIAPVDVIHAHDWPTGLLPVYKSLRYKHGPLEKTGVLFTIHNLSHAGKYQKDCLQRIGLPDWLYDKEQLEFFGGVSLMKAGILWSTMVSTVSPTYAKEIQGTETGSGLEGLLKKRIDDFVGVLNGIDKQVWDPAVPESDPAGGPWPVYGENQLSHRDVHRMALRTHFNLKTKIGKPIFGFVGALSEQRGVPALLDVIPRIVELGGQVVVLGSGSESFEKELEEHSNTYKSEVGVAIGFHPILAKRIYAGADFFLMPSKFEPCGISQMIACRYGAIPIVSFTGGLADTVRDADSYSDGNGLTFHAPVTLEIAEWRPVAARELGKAVERAMRLFEDPARFDSVRRQAMQCDFSWDRSARKYEDIYSETMRRERGEAGHFGP